MVELAPVGSEEKLVVYLLAGVVAPATRSEEVKAATVVESNEVKQVAKLPTLVVALATVGNAVMLVQSH
jgi:hypothetical protein